MAYKNRILIGLLSLNLLSGCSSEKAEDTLYRLFEAAAQQEKDLSNHVIKLKNFETQDQNMYEQILKEGKKDNILVTEKINKVFKNLNERKEILKKEEEIIDASLAKFKNTSMYIKKLENKVLQQQAQQVKELYQSRYKAFKNMKDKYLKLLGAEKELYEKLKTKDTNLKKIKEKVGEINNLHTDIKIQIEKFNNYTQKYNEEKLNFYKQANLNIKVQK
ncbi:YkyA family protein [Bacillus albus]|uniref:YkyA family protein n=1 Tax=Bacillus cereus group TaxID=86661 RepID=UPI001C10FADB|nr:YkyA family protein [Bacillus albus]MBU5220714.1 YkyA family protein [Bacillus albus]MCU4836762.1 YkyA family protein [Bacillus cereus]